MKPRPKLRLWQLSLRTTMLVTTLLCVATGIYARWIRPRPLELLVNEFNTAIDERRYDDAFALGSEARWGYPKSDVAELLFLKGEFARQISTNTEPVDNRFVGTHCYFGEGIPGDESVVSNIDTKKWEALGAKLMQR